jgi:hypothetical protein
MRRSINDFVRIHLKSVLPMELIEQLHRGATIPPYQPWDWLPDDYPQPSDLGPRWGGFDAVSEYNRFDVTRNVHLSEHGANVVEGFSSTLPNPSNSNCWSKRPRRRGEERLVSRSATV